jgi:RNA polymerase sigma factor (sigma-70 family)
MPAHARTLLAHLTRLTSPVLADADLLARWTDRRDEAAFAELVVRHGAMVLGVCHRVLGDAQLAEDAFQATFLVLSRKAAGLRRPESLASFLYGVALRLAYKSRKAVRRRLSRPISNCPEPADPHAHALDALSGRELLTVLDEEIARLPEMYRLPVLVCVLQERSTEEAARLLGWAIGSVRGRLARGRKRLREQLVRRGLSLSAGAVALLAPAVVPDSLRAATLRNLTTPTAAIQTLAAGSTLTLARIAACLGLVVIMIGVASGLPFLSKPVPETPPPLVAAVAEQAKDEIRRDRYGDPLPTGAVTRLGTLRFRVPGEIDTLALSPDGRGLMVSANSGLLLLDASTGNINQSSG